MNKLTSLNGRLIKRMRFLVLFLILGLFVFILPGFHFNTVNGNAGPVMAAPPQKVSEPNPWEFIDESSIASTAQRRVVASAYKTMRLNKQLLSQLLDKTPLESSGASAGQAVMTLPVPDGSYARFSAVESPVVEPQLAAAFPQIRTFRGQGIDDPTASVRFDWTPEGLHAMVLSAGETFCIDPYAKGDTDNYVGYYRKNSLSDSEPFRCSTVESGIKSAALGLQAVSPAFSSAGTLRTYRLAVAATGEYTNTFRLAGDTDAQAKSRALSAIVTVVNRINLLYERDLSARFMLVADEMNIIYPNPAADPYTDGNSSAMINQNQLNLDKDNVIGDGNYDIGHVFGAAGGGGRAILNGVCSSGNKGSGATSLSPPTGDFFAIDYVSHEIGHQFGAVHTFNAASDVCGANRSPSGAYEVGAGSTIMAYTYLCQPQNLQAQKNDYYHVISLDQMLNHINNTSCPATAGTGNSAPSVDAGPNYLIPRATPFTLTASGSDPNSDPLTYTWEEFDLGPTSPPDTDLDGNARPIFRSYPGTTSPSRTFPSLSYVLDSANVPPSHFVPFTSSHGFLIGEALPLITRAMIFQVTARDNRSGGGGISSDSMQLTVTASAGPFYVTQPSAATTWPQGSQQTVTWNVANTNNTLVRCANVKISLSTDGGNSFPTVLAASTSNDGSQAITVPSTPTTTARVKVEAIGNIFFDISDTNFIIPAGSCAYDISPLTRSVGSAQSSKTITVTQLSGTGCGWQAKSNAPWLIITSGSGTGNGTVTYTVLTNLNGATRIGTISVAGKTQTITQSPDGTCLYSINPSSGSYGPGGGAGRVDVTTTASCYWVATTDAPWINITSGSAVFGGGPVLYSVTPNVSSSPRNGTLTVAGMTVNVTQSGNPNPPGTNLALNRPASQSSTAYNGTADRAVDGNASGIYDDGHATHTSIEPNPWWQVDLQAVQTIQTITLFNRTDCCGDRLNNSWVFVSDVPFVSNNLTDIINQSGMFKYFINTAADFVTVPVDRTGRYVRVHLDGSGSREFSLAEVEVIGNASTSVVNLALNKPASQSSTAYGGTADRGVDGNASGVFTDGHMTHSAIELNPWWQVDLQGVQTVQSIKLYNRTECCGDRLNNSWVFVSQASFGTKTLSQILADPSISKFQIGTAGSLVTIPVSNVQGQYVRVQLDGSTQREFSLAEVEVFGPSSSQPPSNVALNKPANQSSTAYGGTADRGVDGNASGVFTDGHMTHSAIEFNPWWEVNLQALKTVQLIKVYNRTECCGDRLNNSWVFISQTPFGTKTLSQILADPSISKFQIGTAGSLVTIPVSNVQGQYVRVQLDGSTQREFSLAEVEVWSSN